MASQETFQSALTQRSLRTVRSELAFLADAGALTPQQLVSILSQLPGANESERQEMDRQMSAVNAQPSPVQLPPPAAQTVPPPAATPAPYSPPTSQLANTSLNEKSQYGMNAPQQHYASPPPAYPQAPTVLSVASALYAYTPTDAGDLALQPNDRVQVLEHMNADWWRGRNERTNLEGIFPRSYVNVLDEKPAGPPPPSNYGNMPLDVSQSGSSSTPGKGGKFEEHGKKFGKKMGNAAIFGAGATIGSNIVNSIF